MEKIKVLFFAEGATLAHVVRPLTLAQGLDLTCFTPTLCRPKGFSKFTDGLGFPVLDLNCQDGRIFARKLELGLPLYDFSTLCRYVDEDLALIDQETPDVIVGDFRLSLSVSARLRSIPYITICDAYWSPERQLSPPLPVLGFTRFLPIPLARLLFRQFSPLAFRVHALPLERLRAKFGLPSLGYDLRRCYTDADLRLFANFPALFPEVKPSANADFIGPINWSAPFDGNLDFLEGDGPLTYITMGSSGNPRVIEKIVPILEHMGSRIAIATAGKKILLKPTLSTTKIFDFLPGSVLCKHADLVICNGGSPTTNQALSYGVPVLGIAQNMDQFLNMEAISTFGAGLMIRADKANSTSLETAVKPLTGNPEFATQALKLAQSRSSENSSNDQKHATFAQYIKRLANPF